MAEVTARHSSPSPMSSDEKEKGIPFQEDAYAVDSEKRSLEESDLDTDDHVEVIRKAEDVATTVRFHVSCSSYLTSLHPTRLSLHKMTLRCLFLRSALFFSVSG